MVALGSAQLKLKTTFPLLFFFFSLSSKVQLHHPPSELAITEMNCLAVMDNMLEIIKVVSIVSKMPYDNSMWESVNMLSRNFTELEVRM